MSRTSTSTKDEEDQNPPARVPNVPYLRAIHSSAARTMQTSAGDQNCMEGNAPRGIDGRASRCSYRALMSFLRRATSIQRLIGASSFVILVSSFLFGCSKGKNDNVSNLSGASTESVWIVHSITEEITRVAAYSAKLDQSAAKPDFVEVAALPRDANGFHFSVTVRLPKQDEFKSAIHIPNAIWDGKAYTAFARDVLAKLHASPPLSRDPIKADPIAPLISLRAGNIQDENKRVSDWLTSHPLDPIAHQQAALVIGALGMRENSGEFTDTRGFCNHMAAHLALAGALNSGKTFTDSGVLAELLEEMLMGAGKDCDTHIDALAARIRSVPELRPWMAAAKLRNRHDHRVLKSPAEGTLLEKIEFFRATCETLGVTPARGALGDGMDESLPDWTRILLASHLKLAEGRELASGGLALEFSEARKIFPVLGNPASKKDAIANTLNRAPGHMVKRAADGTLLIEVIDDGAWAMFFQRHICHVVGQTYAFMRNVWKAPDAAETFRSAASDQCEGLALFPLAAVDAKDKTWIRSKADAIIALITAHPEAITDTLWGRALGTQRDAGTIPLEDWFLTGLPPGTAYGFASRVATLPQVKNLAATDVEHLHTNAPWDYGIGRRLLELRVGDHPTGAQFKQLLGAFLEYYSPAMRDYAALVKGNPAEYTEIMRRLAEQDPDCWVELANYFIVRGPDEAAAEAFEAAFSHDADPVLLASQCLWLVYYYMDHDKLKRALEIAKFAADVGTSAGMEVMGRLQERLGNLPEAERIYLKIRETLQDRSPISAFYYRQGFKNPESGYRKKFEALEAEVFPDAPRSVLVSDFDGPPKHGVIIPQPSDIAASAGFKASDIIVAIDEKEVANLEQYTFIRGLTESNEMDFIVYSGGKYRPLHATVVNRDFGMTFDTYNPPTAP